MHCLCPELPNHLSQRRIYHCGAEAAASVVITVNHIHVLSVLAYKVQLYKLVIYE